MTLVIFVRDSVLVTDLLIKVILKTSSELTMLVLQCLHLTDMILVVLINEFVLMADLLRMSLLDLCTFLVPGVSVSLVRVALIVDFVVLGADLGVMAFLVATCLCCMVIL